MNILKSRHLAVLLSVFVAIILFLVLEFTLSKLNQPYGNVINFSGVKNQYIQFEKPQTLELYGSFLFNGINDTLVFQKILATRIDIFVNGKHITTFGDGTGNLWPTALTVTIPKWILKKDSQNTLRLKIYGIAGAGMYGEPYITNIHNAKRIANAINIFRNSITLVGIGATTMILYLLLIALESASGLERKAYKNIIIASVFMILSLLQFVYRESSGSVVTYLIFEQFARTTPMFVLTFLLFAIVELASLRERIGKTLKTMLITIPTILISIMLFSTQIKYIHLIGAISDLYALILLSTIIFLIARYKFVEFIFPVTFLLLTGIQTFYVLLSQKSSELMIHYGRIVFLIYVGTITLRKFKELSITHEKLKKENLVDHLTGVFNRKAIDIIPKGGTLVLIDLDGFKKINDRYGHIHGDMILKKFSQIINDNIRTGDYFIRLGGDEFCIVFKTVKLEDVPKVMERLYNESRNHLGLGFSYGYSEFDDFDKAYDAADRMMYERKENRYKLKK